MRGVGGRHQRRGCGSMDCGRDVSVAPKPIGQLYLYAVEHASNWFRYGYSIIIRFIALTHPKQVHTPYGIYTQPDEDRYSSFQRSS